MPQQMDQLEAGLGQVVLENGGDVLSRQVAVSERKDSNELENTESDDIEMALPNLADSPPKRPPRTKVNSKQAKKERKLLQAFVQKVLLPKLSSEPPELAEQLLNPSQSFKVGETYRSLLVDNRDYQVKLSTEELLEAIKADGGTYQLVDCFVLPSKVWLLLQFASSEHLAAFKGAFLKRTDLTGINQFSVISDQIYELTVQRYLPEVEQIVETFNPANLPSGLQVIEEFIGPEEEATLIGLAEKCFQAPEDSKQVSHLKNRAAVHFGHVFDYTRNTISSDASIAVQSAQLPAECGPILERFLSAGLITELPDQLTINRYRGGPHADHIPAHVDTHSMCTEWIIALSCGSSTVMSFTSPRDSAPTAVRQVSLPARSAVVMRDEARYLWRHAILQTAVDMRPLRRNTPPAKSQSDACCCRLSLAPRDTRYSFTFRKVRPPGYRCQCPFAESCDSQSSQPAQESHEPPSLEPITESRAVELEREYVHRTYEQIASHFSATRYGQWPSVVDFLSSLPTGSLVLDVGCGNGKYLGAQPDRLVMLGSDRSANLLSICRQRGFETFQDDVLTIGDTVRGGLFDGLICIAVLHHLATEERRLAAVESLIKLLKPGGRGLIYVWAFEQKKDGTASRYLKEKNQTQSASEEPEEEAENGQMLRVHQNRTEFKQQDLFVPWKRPPAVKTANSAETTSEPPSEALRFYHVFREGELEAMLVKLNSHISVERLYYDQGNWCAIFAKH